MTSSASAAVSPVSLAIDTATSYLSLALQWQGAAGPQSLEHSEPIGRAHAELTPQHTQQLFAKAGLPFVAHNIVIGTGAGSYTGVRIGASYALGLASVWGAKLLGVPTLEALIDPTQQGRQSVSLDARKGQVYAAHYLVSTGCVSEVLVAPHKLAAEEFVQQAQAQGSSLVRQDVAPSALALLQAGLAHGRTDWQLLYL